MRCKDKLAIYEYQEIFKRWWDEGWGVRQIGRHLGRSESTISRALSRDVHPCPGIWRRMTTYEKAMHCWRRSVMRRASSRKGRRRLKTLRLLKIVEFLLIKWIWSPEKISNFLKRHEEFLSAKAIYNFIKFEKPKLVEYLRLRGKPRRQRVSCQRSYFKSGVPEKRNIRERPPTTGGGHWEVDTIHSVKGSKGGILTLRELKSRERIYFRIADREAKTITAILLVFFGKLEPHMRKTLTSDNGSEFADLYKLQLAFKDFFVYYCDPYKAYQRGQVENANGELRWFFPKKTDFSKVAEKDLKRAQWLINNRPMKVLDGNSASKVYKQLLAA